MSSQEKATERVDIVLIGQFNPQIFQPAWFAAEGLIGEEAAKNAHINIIHPEITDFSTKLLRIVVERRKFTAGTSYAPQYDILRDLVVGTFRLLHYTPIDQLGINRSLDFKTQTESEWHNFGHVFAPKEPWRDVLNEPGLVSMIMHGKRPNDHEGYIRTQIQPSSIVHQGISISINDHYVIKKSHPSEGADKIVELLSTEWGTSLVRSDDIAKRLMEQK